MKSVRRVLVILASLGFLLPGSAIGQAVPSTPQAADVKDEAAPPCPMAHRAPSTIPPPTPAYPQGYFHDDWRLGPGYLPPNPPLGPLLRDYRRTDNESSTEFLDCYWN